MDLSFYEERSVWPAERLQRRPRSHLSADVVRLFSPHGYRRGWDLARLKAMRRDIIDPLIAAHWGRTFKLMGDGALVEFASAVDAVTCAIQVQKQVSERNSGSPERQSNTVPDRH